MKYFIIEGILKNTEKYTGLNCIKFGYKHKILNKHTN